MPCNNNNNNNDNDDDNDNENDNNNADEFSGVLFLCKNCFDIFQWNLHFG